MAMDIIDYFKEMAVNAEQDIGQLANQKQGQLNRKKALDQIESRLQQMAADGTIDQSEVDELMEDFKRQGLPAGDLALLFDQLKGTDTAVRGDQLNKLKSAVENKLGGAQSSLGDDEGKTQFQIQMAMSDYNNGLSSASSLSKAEHDAYMVAIKNICG